MKEIDTVHTRTHVFYIFNVHKIKQRIFNLLVYTEFLLWKQFLLRLNYKPLKIEEL